MPFVETYSVTFSNGNLIAHVNTRNWPDMVLSAPTPNDQAERFPDASGLNLKMTRDRNVPATASSLNSVYVVPPAGSVPLDTRLLMLVTFDLPNAEGLSPLTEDVGALARFSPGGRSPSANEIEPPGILSPFESVMSNVTVPEPWAVALNVSAENPLPPIGMVNLTCQFNRQFDGVRVNTPGNLQRDQAATLESPLNYGAYQGGYVSLPDGTDGVVDPPVFTLEHSFCGWNFAANGHTVGAGSLKISRAYAPLEAHDHRVYSSDALASAPQPVTSIRALGTSLAAVGVGRMSVRLRTFSLWFN